MQELFRVEAENQTALLTSGLLELERAPASAEQLERLMRAAHSFKGAARIVDLAPAVQIAHAMEDCFVAAQRGSLELGRPHIDALLRGVDWLVEVAGQNESSIAAWVEKRGAEMDIWLQLIRGLMSSLEAPSPAPPDITPTPPGATLVKSTEASPALADEPEESDRFLRLTAENLNRLLALAGESLVESRWLRPFSESMQRLKRMQLDVERTLDNFRQSVDFEALPEAARIKVAELLKQTGEARNFLNDRLQELDLYDRRSANLSTGSKRRWRISCAMQWTTVASFPIRVCKQANRRRP